MRIASRFTIQDIEADLIGRGGMGELYRGVDEETGTIVAIKRLKPEVVAGNPHLLERFAREGEALRRLNHPNIVRMLATADETDPATGAIAHYLIMEFVEGGSLREQLEQQGRLPVRRVLEIALELSDALARAHHLGIVHRDLKPSNVLLAADGTPRLTDFGVAHWVEKPGLTQTGMMIGTIDYFSPEICSGEKPDASSDIWSLGIMLFEMLSGERPFTSRSIAGTLTAILTRPLPDLAQLRPDVDKQLATLVTRVLEKDRQQRICSARLMGVELEAILHGQASQLDNLKAVALDREESESLWSEQREKIGSPEQLPAAVAQTNLTKVRAIEQRVRDDGAMASPIRSSPTTGERRNLLILLEKVKHFWIHGVLEYAEQHPGLLELEWQRCDKYVEHPWRGITAGLNIEQLSDERRTDTCEAFVDSDRSLLVLGMPGSGKTITLLELARWLAAEAELSPEEPIPVILNLTSWSENRQSLADWIVEELTAKYQIPRKMGRTWLDADAVVLLLDALDGVPDAHRSDCIAAINAFREEHGLSGLVICSRLEEYLAADRRLKLGGALEIKPLSPGQIDGYLASAGERLDGLRQALRPGAGGDDLLNMASSPLMLNVMSVAFSDVEPRASKGADGLSHVFGSESRPEGTAVRRRRLFEIYVQRMLASRTEDAEHSPEETQERLSWLAQKMFGHNMAVFLIEQLQPSWLDGDVWQWAHVICLRLTLSIFAGIMVWMVVGLGNVQLISGISGLVVCVLLALFIGSLVAIWDGKRMVGPGLRDMASSEGRRSWFQAATIGVVSGLVSWAVLTFFGMPAAGASYVALWMGAFFTMMTYDGGTSLRNQIITSEALSWSWSTAIKGILPGTGMGFVFAIVTALYSGAFTVELLRNIFLPWVLAFCLLNGLRGRQLERTSKPNQGIRLSARNGAFAGLLVGSIFGSYFLIILFLAEEPPQPAIVMGALLALGAGLKYGGGVIEHAILRLLLWRARRLPLQVASFLDYAARLIILHKVGGGYIFMHRALQEYFADLRLSSTQDT